MEFGVCTFLIGILVKCFPDLCLEYKKVWITLLLALNKLKFLTFMSLFTKHNVWRIWYSNASDMSIHIMSMTFYLHKLYLPYNYEHFDSKYTIYFRCSIRKIEVTVKNFVLSCEQTDRCLDDLFRYIATIRSFEKLARTINNSGWYLSRD